MIGQIFDASEYAKRLKATVQATGKLGFTQETSNKLLLTTDCSVILAGDDASAEVMYMAVVREESEQGFPVLSAGPYFYLNTRQLFDKIGLNYTSQSYMFDLIRFEEGDAVMGGECYKMKLRTGGAKSKGN